MSGEQIKPGYKRSEVGVIPQEWTAKRLREISPAQSVGLVINPSTYFDLHGAVPMLVGSNVSENSIDWAGARRISLSSHRKLPASSIYENDLVTVRVGDPGVTAVVPKEFHDSNCASVMIVRGHSSFDSTWLCHLMNSHLGRSQVESIQYGTAQKQFNISDAINFQYPTPPLLEQHAIAAALADVDFLLAKIDLLIAKKRDLKQAAMQQLLTGQTRLSGFSRDWEVKRLKSLGNTYGGLIGKTKEDFGRGSAHYIPFMNVMASTVINPDWLEKVDVAQNESQNVAKKGDLFFNGSSETPEEVGFCSVLLTDVHDLYLNSFCFGFRFNADAKVNGLFFAYWFRCQEGRKAMSLLAQGATRYNIAKRAFLQLEIPQPSADEQAAIATVLSDLDAELAALEVRRDKTRAIKQGMMQELLTGRIRLH